jgi:hypothetical protein
MIQNSNLKRIHYFNKPRLEFTKLKHEPSNNNQAIKYTNLLPSFSNSSAKTSSLVQNSTFNPLSEINFMYSFLVENSFVRHSKQSFKKPNLILTQAPLYKMDDTSSVTSNRDRGNIYTSLNFLQNKTY